MPPSSRAAPARKQIAGSGPAFKPCRRFFQFWDRQIVEKRKATPYGERERDGRLYRRRRYVKFNVRVRLAERRTLV